MPDVVGKVGWQLKRALPRELYLPLKNGWFALMSRRKAAIRASMPRVTVNDLVHDLQNVGIRQGDTLFVHSALSKIGDVEEGAKTVIAALRAAVGPTGNIVMPAYLSADDYVAALDRGEVLDLRTARSATGKITEEFRSAPDVLRSSHPFSSCVAAGPDAAYIVGGHQNDPRICHAQSPLARAIELHAKILCLGTDIGTISLYHCAEDTWDGFPFPTYGERFEGRYIDARGEMVERPLMRYDPDVAKYRIDQPHGEWIRDRLREHFQRKQLLQRFTFGAAPSLVIDANALYQETCELARQGVTIYTRESQSHELERIARG